jgi:hypothetical protein
VGGVWGREREALEAFKSEVGDDFDDDACRAALPFPNHSTQKQYVRKGQRIVGTFLLARILSFDCLYKVL